MTSEEKALEEQGDSQNSKLLLEDYESRRHRIFLLVGIRTLILVALFCSTVVAHINAKSGSEVMALVPLYTVCGLFFLANLIYCLLFKLNVSNTFQIIVQLGGDILFAAVIVHLTGGVQSAFAFFYVLTAINSAVFFNLHGALLTASGAVLIYLTQVLFQLYNILTPYSLGWNSKPQPMTFLNNALVYTFAIYAGVILTSFLYSQTIKAHKRTVELGKDLSQLKELHLAVVQNMPVGVVTLDSNAKVIFVNHLAEPLLGNQAEIGANLTTLFGQNLADYSNGRVITITNNEQPMALLVRFSPLTHNDQILGNIVTIQDVSLVQKMERELHDKERLASVGELAAGMAHEIRNPLASIRGSVEMLSRRISKEQNAEQRLMGIAIREIDRLNQLITDFLNYSRPQTLNLESCNLKYLCEETVALLQVNLPENIQIRIEGDIKGSNKLDIPKIRQVIWNLIKNGVDACNDPDKSYLIKLELAENDQNVILKVSDNGSGINEHDKKSIFLPFFSTKSQGNGLGLAIVRRLIEDHGGNIDLQSEEGVGTTFEIVLPGESLVVKEI